jgi:two-component system, LytTR family, response regulator
MKVLVIDNETPIREGVVAMLELFCPEVEQIESASDIPSGVQKIRQFKPDLLLLDVELDDGTGFDLLKQVVEPHFQLIFITAHDKYAIDAFRFSAIDFLLKPLDPDALAQSVQKAAKNLKTQDLSEQISYLLGRMAAPQESPKRIILKDTEHIYYLRCSEINFCEADGVYTKFHLENGRVITVSKNLKEYELILEPLGFLRTHNSFLVNPEKILRFEKSSERLILEQNLSVPLAHRKKELVLRILEQRGG